jgi:hypothetical protein
MATFDKNMIVIRPWNMPLYHFKVHSGRAMYFILEDLVLRTFYCTPDIYTVHPENGHRSDRNM